MFIYIGFVFQAPLQGKSHSQYVKQGAFCLETQKYPDAVNHVSFQYHCPLSTSSRSTSKNTNNSNNSNNNNMEHTYEGDRLSK